MKLNVTTNFDFMKLRDKVDKVLSDGMGEITHSAAKGARERIEKGLTPPLKQSTLDMRKKRATGGSKPLYETGALHRSIKSTKDGVEMLDYGLKHHRGYRNRKKSLFPNAQVPARPFIEPSKKDILDPMKKLYMDMHKALRKVRTTIK